ncbi:MAG TPA: PqqD family protein, partial [Vicinamibacterales bacterium]|nr:PqqD family protein [Vicinamibacterales bacterium]
YSSRVTLTPQSRITLSKDQTSCDLAGDMAIVNFANGVYYGLDPTGARIWKLLAATTTVEELCNSLGDIYDVERARLESDVQAFVADLARHGLVEIA